MKPHVLTARSILGFLQFLQCTALSHRWVFTHVVLSAYKALPSPQHPALHHALSTSLSAYLLLIKILIFPLTTSSGKLSFFTRSRYVPMVKKPKPLSLYSHCPVMACLSHRLSSTTVAPRLELKSSTRHPNLLF